MGVHFRVNMSDPAIAQSTREAIRAGGAPDGTAYEFFAPSRALGGFHQHRVALDTIVWAEEEGDQALLRLTPNRSGRFFLSADEVASLREARIVAANAACERYGVDTEALLALSRFLAERWSEWEDEGRPLIAHAYKVFLGSTVGTLQQSTNMDFQAISAAVGRQGSGFGNTLEVVWPDWAATQKERLARTLRNQLPESGPGAVSAAQLDAFSDFLYHERQDAFFLRLESFERNVFEDVDAADAGMAADLQGMAVAVEHAVRAMGGTRSQLYEMFKELWAGSSVGAMLNPNAELARRSQPASDWENTKAKIEELRTAGPAASVTADLVMAHRLRGAVHNPIPEQDQFERERLFVGLLRAAVMTYAQVERAKST